MSLPFLAAHGVKSSAEHLYELRIVGAQHRATVAVEARNGKEAIDLASWTARKHVRAARWGEKGDVVKIRWKLISKNTGLILEEEDAVWFRY